MEIKQFGTLEFFQIMTVIWVKSLSINIETYTMSGIVIVVLDIPVTIMLDQLILIHLNIQQKVSFCMSSFWIGLHIQICERKHPVNAKCAHIPLPLVILVTLTNKSIRRDIRTICEISKNGKQYLNIV